MASSIAVRIVFGLLVVATLAAFVVTQRLKSAAPVVSRVFYQPWISPNGDGRKDVVRMRFRLPRADRVTVSVVSAGGDEVRRLADDRQLAARTHYFHWNGRTDARTRVPDGPYRLRVTLRSRGRSLTTPRTVTVDTVAPRPRIVAVSPATIVPGDRGRRRRARIRYEGPSDPAPRFAVFRADRPGEPRRVSTFSGPRFRRIAEWDGTVEGRRPAPDGIYAFAVTVRDEAGNAGTAPRALPPRRGSTTPRSGVSVRYLTVAGPLHSLRPRAIARFSLGPRPRRFRWRLDRLGAGTPLTRGRGSGSRLAVRVPSRARPGIYVLRVQAGGRRAAWPLSVGGGRRERPLVVAPAIAWQGLNAVDDDQDGFADTLLTSASVSTARPLAHGRLPGGLRRHTGLLLRFLDSEGLGYDLTSDVDLARRPELTRGRPAVVFAGSQPWLTERLDAALRGYVEGGGRVASFGVDSFRRRVTLEAARLADPSPPEAANVFGERTSLAVGASAPMVVALDSIGLFSGSGGQVGSFSSFERSESRVPGARMLVAAGPEPERPAFVVYRLGRGLVARAGSEQWARALADRGDAARITRRLWALLSR